MQAIAGCNSTQVHPGFRIRWLQSLQDPASAWFPHVSLPSTRHMWNRSSNRSG